MLCSVFFEKIFCTAGLAMGATVSVGQAVGAGDKRRAAECVGNTVTLFMVLAVALTVVLLLVSVRGIVAAVSLVSVVICLAAYALIRRRERTMETAG